MDRSDSLGAEGGPLFLELRSALYDMGCRIPMIDYVYGLGGADVRLELIREVYTDLADLAAGSPAPLGITYLGAK